ncbi:MAG: MFS transporter [Firmicutes bacterium]|nr:MFS transporter [Bacillota bacterium]
MSQLAILSLIAVLHFTSWHLVSPYIALVAKGQGAGMDTIGLIMAAYSALPTVFALPTGVMCDRIGTRNILIGSTIGIAASACVLLGSRSINLLALSLAALGFFHVLQLVASQVMIGDTADGNTLYRNFSIYSFACCAGHLIGPPVGGFMVKQFDYNLLFILAAALALLMVPLSFLADERSKPLRTRSGNSWQITKTGLQNLLHKPTYVISLLGIFGILVLYSLRSSFYSVYFDAVGLDAPLIGLLLTFQVTVEAAIRPFLTVWRSRYGIAPLLLLALGVCALSGLLTAFCTAVVPLAIILGLGGMGYGTVQPISMALASQAGQEGERGLAMGLRMSINRLAGMVAPLFLGKIGDMFGLKYIFIITSVSLVICLAAIYILAAQEEDLWLAPGQEKQVSI